MSGAQKLLGTECKIYLTARELQLLCYLVERTGSTVPRTELLRSLWGYEAGAFTSYSRHACVQPCAKSWRAIPDGPSLFLLSRESATNSWIESEIIFPRRGASAIPILAVLRSFLNFSTHTRSRTGVFGGVPTAESARCKVICRNVQNVNSQFPAHAKCKVSVLLARYRLLSDYIQHFVKCGYLGGYFAL